MSRHLSSEEISQWALGEYSADLKQHLADCSNCRAELALFNTTLSLFRKSAHDWADQQCPSEAHTLRRIKQAPYRSVLNVMCLAAVISIFCLLAARSLRQNATMPVMNAAAVNDAVLLERVNAQLSQDVPTSLAPLNSLVSWESTETAVNQVAR